MARRCDEEPWMRCDDAAVKEKAKGEGERGGWEREGEKGGQGST